MGTDVIVRPSVEADAPALAAIYGHYVREGFGTFEEVPPTSAAMAERRAAVIDSGLPYLVAEREGGVIGYAYASIFRPRTGYRYTVEDSVYVAPGAEGQGVGRMLLAAVLAACETKGLRQVIAVIGDSENTASIALHHSLGFTPCGVVRSVGFKHGRWVDTVWMQKALNGGDETRPDTPGLQLGER